jgi:ryanodine receptor 2
LTYQPKPIDVSGVTLSPEILELTEYLAKNTHEVWASQRMREGWTFGERRDDAARTHPSLIPYEDLPESEKEYDRQTAMQALKAIVALGYEITKPKG